MDSLQHTLRFPRRSRLKSPATIRNVTRDGNRVSGYGFTVHWSSEPTESINRPAEARPRIAFVVSRRCGKAHQRNRIKRRLREAVRINRASWPQSMSVIDIVFRATGSETAHMDFQDLTSQVGNVLTNISDGPGQ